MTHATRRIWTLVFVIASMAFGMPAGRVGASQPATAPGTGPGTAFVYLHSRQPAAGLRVVQELPTGEDVEALTDAGGRAALTAGSIVRVFDPQADEVQLWQDTLGESVPASIDVPEAIRVAGTIDAAAMPKPRVQIGYGPRITAGRRFRREFDRALVETEAENRPFGLELPRSAQFWRDAAPGADGAFLSGWIPATDTPQVLVSTASGLVAVEDVALAGVQPRGTVRFAAPLRVVQTKRLTFNYASARRRVATDAHVYLRDARWREEDRAFIARYLSVLDRLDVFAFVFAADMRPFPVGAGATPLSWLPPFTEIDVRMIGAVMGAAVDGTVAMPGPVSALRVDGRQILPKATQTLPLLGSVVFEHTHAPVPDAKVVYSCYPEKEETTTDRFGNFVIPQACVGRELTLFVSAEDRSSPPRWAPSQTTHRMTHAAGDVKRIVITLPEQNVPFAGRPALPLPTPTDIRPATLKAANQFYLAYPGPLEKIRWPGSGSVLPTWAARIINEDDQVNARTLVYMDTSQGPEYNDVVEAEWHNKDTGEVYITVAQSGTWSVGVELSPCLLGVNTAVNFTANVKTAVKLTTVSTLKPKVSITVFRAIGFAAPVAEGTAIYFPSPIVDPDAFEWDADRQGVVRFETCDVNALDVFVADEDMGYFDGQVRLDDRGYGMVTLVASPPWNATTAPSSAPPPAAPAASSPPARP